MPVIPQPSMTTCSLLLLDRREENAVILVGDEVLNAHVVPQRMPLAQLQHALGVSLCRDHCKQHFPSNHRIESGQWFRTEKENDDASITQKHPGIPIELLG